MSSIIPFLKKWVFILKLINFSKSFVINLFLLHAWETLLHFPVVESIASATFDIPCFFDNNCSAITGNSTCDTLSGMCTCAEGNVRMKHVYHCLRFASIGEDCQGHEQCMHSGPNVVCHWTQRCGCQTGYERKEVNNTLTCVKSRHVENKPYIVHVFSGLGPLPILLGCLTGGLALLACFAGIIQLVRTKYMRHRCDGVPNSEFSPDLGYSTTSAPSQSQPFSDSQFTTSPPSGGDFACLDGNSTAPPTPGALDEDDYIVTPPPTYEEAVQSDRRKAGSAITL